MFSSLNTPKTATGFTLPTTSTSTSGFSFGMGDAKVTKPTLTFGTPNVAATAPSTGFSLGAPVAAPSTAATSAPQFNFSAPMASTGVTGATPAVPTTLSFSLATTSTPSLFSLSGSSASAATTPATTSAPGFSLTNTTLAVKLPISSTTATTSTALTNLPTVSAPAVSLSASTTTVSSATTIPTGNLTFAQLEDNINKWTVDLEEQGKHFTNQAKQINAWDRLLITNGEKILSLSTGVDRVKQLQQQLDQELDFVLAQQKELEDLIVPLEKDLGDVPVTDDERNQTYQMAETLDTQLKQMSEDLKEIIEHLNESNKNQELTNPITQIGRILNAHMNSLQWIDQNTTKITTHLDQIAKKHELNKRNHELNLQKTYD